MNQDPKEKYLEQIVADFGMSGASIEEQARVLEMAEERFEDVIMQTSIALMDEEQRKQFSQILDSPGKEHKLAEITAQIPGLDEAIEKALILEYEILKAGMQS